MSVQIRMCLLKSGGIFLCSCLMCVCVPAYVSCESQPRIGP